MSCFYIIWIHAWKSSLERFIMSSHELWPTIRIQNFMDTLTHAVWDRWSFFPKMWVHPIDLNILPLQHRIFSFYIMMIFLKHSKKDALGKISGQWLQRVDYSDTDRINLINVVRKYVFEILIELDTLQVFFGYRSRVWVEFLSDTGIVIRIDICYRQFKRHYHADYSDPRANFKIENMSIFP